MINLEKKTYQSGYILNLSTIKKLGKTYKLCTFNIPIRQSGFEGKKKFNSKNTVNDKKLLNNIIRAKTTVRNLALCNEFDYFITLTLDKKKYDRYDLKKFIQDLGQFVRDYRKKYKYDIQYILIPEQHWDGAWHMHGLIKNVCPDHLISFDDIEQAPDKLKGKDYYNFFLYERKFGFNSFGKIKDNDKCANYIVKYIGKSMGDGVELGNKSYYPSRGLKKPEIIKKGILSDTSLIEYDFVNDYCKIKNIDFEQLNNLQFIELV